MLASAVVMAFAAGAAALSPASPVDPPKLLLTPCAIEGIEKPARCGTVMVRENHDDPRSRQLPLKLVILPAKSGKARVDPVFYFEGGPGERATESAAYMADAWFRADNDVVLVDQRGTGPGHRLTCNLPGSDENFAGFSEQPYRAFAECSKTLGAAHDLTRYTSADFVRDIEQVRQMLGYGKINLYGASYGARAAIVFARTHPKQVRSIYLSGVAPLELKMPLYFPWSAQRALDATLGTCARDPACATTYPDPAGDLKSINQRLTREPATVAVRDPKGQTVAISLTQWGFASALLRKLYTAQSPADLPATLSKGRGGDFRDLAQAWLDGNRAGQDATAWGLNRALVCSEDVSRIGHGEVEREAQGTFLGATLGLATVELCKSWPRAAFPAGYFEPRRLSIPTMITSGEYDPVTPPRWGEAARATFPNSFHLVTLHGHSNFREDGCLGEIAGEFLRRATVEGLDLRCAAAPGNGLQVMPDAAGSAAERG